MNIVYYIKFEFNYSFIVIYTTIYTIMIKKEAVGMNKRVCTAAAVLALTMCTVHAEAVYNLDEVIVEADMDKARDAFGDIVTEQSYARTGGDVEVITRKEIEEKHF